MDSLTLIVPYYRNPEMLSEQVRVWADYPDRVDVIVVDDGSPESAREVICKRATSAQLPRIKLFRVDVDIPWNRGGARNLGTSEAKTDWVVHIDIDHVMPWTAMAGLLAFKPDPRRWYRFRRNRNGKADETRRKDKIGEDVEFGPIHPHIDSYLCTRELYWKAGGYNEDFSGCLGGGSPFLAELERVGGAPLMAPSGVYLNVYTRSVIADASDHSLSRERGEFARRKATMKGKYRGHNPIRFPWSKINLQ